MSYHDGSSIPEDFDDLDPYNSHTYYQVVKKMEKNLTTQKEREEVAKFQTEMINNYSTNAVVVKDRTSGKYIVALEGLDVNAKEMSLSTALQKARDAAKET